MSYDNEIAPHSHRLFVKAYNKHFRAHECIVDGTKLRVFVDLLIDGSFPEDVTAASLVGSTVEVDFTYGFLFLAMCPRVVFAPEHVGQYP
jgi:hypothetical protein